MKRFLQFRLGCHQLPIAVGRRNGIARACRLRAHCVVLGPQGMKGTWCSNVGHRQSCEPSMLICLKVVVIICVLSLRNMVIWGCFTMS